MLRIPNARKTTEAIIASAERSLQQRAAARDAAIAEWT
jgi:hypothetical protein